MDVEVGTTAQLPGGRGGLEGPDRGGAHRHHPLGVGAGGHGGRRHGVALGVDDVLLGRRRGDGSERVQPDGQVHAGHAGPGGGAGREQLRREVQAGGGRGRRNGPRDPGATSRPSGSARGRPGAGGCRAGGAWCPSAPTTPGSRSRTRRRPSSAPPSGAPTSTTAGAPGAASGSNRRVPVGQPPTRPDQGLPGRGRGPSTGSRSSTSALPPVALAERKPGGQHPGVVHDHHVTRPQQPGEVGHRGMDGRGVALQPRTDEQAGGAPGLDGALGDGRLGQPVVVGVHGRRPGGPPRPDRPGPRSAPTWPPWWQIRPARPAVPIDASVGPGTVPSASEQRGLDRGHARDGPRPGAPPPVPACVRWSRPCWSR